MADDLYPDFEVSLENCGLEPIHRPVAIQGDGHLMAFECESGRLIALSEGCEAILGLASSEVSTDEVSIDVVFERPREQWLPPALLKIIEGAQVGARRIPPPRWQSEASGESWDVICHDDGSTVVVEFERAQAVSDPYAALHLSDVLEQAQTLEELCEIATASVRESFGYDRVMVYRFDEDHHGFVFGESRREDLEPFLGLHYPASDIPEIARDLFLIARSRSIPDTRLANRVLRFRPGWLEWGEHLDLSRSQLRATSPVHVEYLENMGVRATMTVAIVIDGKLWGLFACHSLSPKAPSIVDRVTAEMAALHFSRRLLEIRDREAREDFVRSQQAEVKFLSGLRIGDHYQLQTFRGSAALEELCGCDGAAIVSQNLAPVATGLVPAPAVLLAVRDRLMAMKQDDAVHTTHQASVDFAEEGVDGALIGGLMAVRVSELTDSYLFWFRRPQRHMVSWAGDPRLPHATERVREDDAVVLSPRQSFDLWQETVEDQSVRWGRSERLMATRVRQEILGKELQRTAERVARSQREFVELTFSAAHDLQEPLRTQMSYLGIVVEELGALELEANEEVWHCLRQGQQSVQRMQELVGELLEYARLGRSTDWEVVDLESLVAELIEDLGERIQEAGAQVECGPLPKLLGERSRFRQLLHNYLSNALKYRAKDRSPDIKIGSRLSGSEVRIFVEDNGIGIAEEDRAKVFRLFTRLHHRDDYPGSGIGLAIALRAVESLGGTSGVESTLGVGSTFWVEFHQHQIAE